MKLIGRLVCKWMGKHLRGKAIDDVIRCPRCDAIKSKVRAGKRAVEK